jgi:hypothetical protein
MPSYMTRPLITAKCFVISKEYIYPSTFPLKILQNCQFAYPPKGSVGTPSIVVWQ